MIFAGGGIRSKVRIHGFDYIITLENLLIAWQQFFHDKKKKPDVMEFNLNLMDNLYTLYTDLVTGTYTHGIYTHFTITDPKKRDIHKSSVRDRIVHHMLYTALYPYFDTQFVYDSYSCRIGKGTHRALERFTIFHRKCSQNNTKTVYVLKCDIKKFFASIDHVILISILQKHIHDERLLKLLENIVGSFNTSGKPLCGLPLGNLTSQLLVNVYMNIFDQYMKHMLREKYYIRYADDFVIMSQDKNHLQRLIPTIQKFLIEKLKLTLHPNKVSIGTVASGVDFLGWVHFPYHRVLRTSTRKRMIRNLERSEYDEKVLASYVGLCSWGDSYKLLKKFIHI